MTSDFEDIMEGLDQARRHAAGEAVTGLAVHVPDRLDVAGVRARSGLSQSAFARSVGVRLNTLQQWEQGRRSPAGPARVLLAIVARDPNVVSTLLGEAEPAGGRARASGGAPRASTRRKGGVGASE